MGVFDDKRYEQLDWVSQAVQPIETPLAALLEKLPEELEVDFNMVTSLDSTGDLNKDMLVQNLIKRFYRGEHTFTWQEQDIICQCFELDMRSEELILNLESRTLSGELYLVKTKFTIDEDALKRIMGDWGREQLNRVNGYNMDSIRANEMLDLLEKCESAMASRSGKVKKQAMVNRISQILKDGEWRVKNTDLANNISIWIKNYIERGDLPSLSNITKLKVMTYKEGPIYSIEETKC